MKIKIEVPADAEITFDETTREFVISPTFTKADGRSTWAYVTVCGDGGATRRATLQCSGKSGQSFVMNTAASKATTSFDKLAEYKPTRTKKVTTPNSGGSFA